MLLSSSLEKLEKTPSIILGVFSYIENKAFYTGLFDKKMVKYREIKKQKMNQESLKKITGLLVAGEFITEDQLKELQAESEAKGMSFEEVIVDNDIITDEQIGQLAAESNGWRFANLEKQPVDETIFRMIPRKVAEKQGVIAFQKTEQGVKVAMLDPEDTTLIHLLEKRLGEKVIPFYSTKNQINAKFSLYKSDIKEEFEAILKAQIENKNKEEQDNAIIDIVNMLLARGYEKGASDIHVEPYEDLTLIRYRIDGVMHEIISLPKKYHDPLISRIKVMSHLRTDEHQVPQDGKLQYDLEGERVDVRVSVVPTTKGENTVMRLLSEKSRQFTLHNLGFSEGDFKKLNNAIKKPWGMILVTGPTGSGKTTSLYSVLKILNKKEVNIATIEDPVEYNLDGITQIQVNPKAELTFSSGLKSIVRQDPDTIMVGEIRDKETASIAVNSAMTGHLVLSTLHTNDAPTTLPRLLDMGVEPFLIASTVNIAIGQRLVRKICQHCIQSHEVPVVDLKEKVPENVLKELAGENATSITLYKGEGCAVCKDTGYAGRLGVFEIMEMDEELRSLIMKNANADEIREKAIEKGMTTMYEDALKKVKNGVTTVEEMLRVVKSQ